MKRIKRYDPLTSGIDPSEVYDDEHKNYKGSIWVETNKKGEKTIIYGSKRGGVMVVVLLTIISLLFFWFMMSSKIDSKQFEQRSSIKIVSQS